jgi:hypothetical protein
MLRVADPSHFEEVLPLRTSSNASCFPDGRVARPERACFLTLKRLPCPRPSRVQTSITGQLNQDHFVHFDFHRPRASIPTRT